MKLKERLAKDWDETGHHCCRGDAVAPYIAGFEKAREMAQERFINKVMVRPKHKEEPTTINTVVVNGELFEFTLLEDFKTLGEEEVE